MDEIQTTSSGGGAGSTLMKIFAIGCGGCLVLLVGVALAFNAMLPSSYSVSRSLVIDAPIEEIFPLVDAPARWPEWDPWTPLDSDMKREYLGPPAGVGAESRWDSPTEEVGAGLFRITESVPGQRIALDIEFTRPFEAKSQSLFTFEETERGVRVTWRDEAELEGISMRFAMGIGAEYLLGPAFEEGLSNLRKLAEGDDEPATPEAEPIEQAGEAPAGDE